MKKFVAILLMMWHVLSCATEELILVNSVDVYQGIQESLDTLSFFPIPDVKKSDDQQIAKLKKILKAVSSPRRSWETVLLPEESNNQYVTPINESLISTICSIKKNKRGQCFSFYWSDKEIKDKKYNMIDTAVIYRDAELLSLVMHVAGKFYSRTDYLNSIFKYHRLYVRGQFIDIGNSYDSHQSHMKDIWFFLVIGLYAYPKRDAFLFSMIELLVKDGIDINMQNQDGKTALHVILGTTPEWVDKFMKFKPDVHICDNENRTLLHFAVDYALDGYNSREMIKKVLDAGVDINARDENGQTALYHTVDSGCYDSLKLLLKLGADMYIPDNKGVSPVQILPYCVRFPNKAIELLQEEYYKIHGVTFDNMQNIILHKGCTIS